MRENHPMTAIDAIRNDIANLDEDGQVDYLNNLKNQIAELEATTSQDSTGLFRTIVAVEVLSQDVDPSDMSLSEIEYEMTEGSFSGITYTQSIQEVSKSEMARLLEHQGSDSSFFFPEDDEEG
jgi:hypothetical protein